MIIDAHVHIGSWKPQDKDYGHNEIQTKKIMQSVGVNKVCAIDVGKPELFKKPNIEERNLDNNFILNLSKKDDFFIPIYWANPFHPEICEKELKTGFKGIKYHCDLHLLPVSDKKIEPLIEIAKKFKMPFFVHTQEKKDIASIFRVKEAAEKYPDVNFVALHAIDRTSITLFEAKKNGVYDLNNIYYCVGGRSLFIEFRELYENVGPEKIIFSSDFPFGHPAIYMKTIETLTKDEKERKLMFETNIKKLLKL